MADLDGMGYEPTVRDLLYPTLNALKRLGGSAKNQELAQEVSEELVLSDSQVNQPAEGGGQTQFEKNLGFARTHLKKNDLLTNSSRGVWAITSLGKQTPEDEVIRQYDAFQMGDMSGPRSKGSPPALTPTQTASKTYVDPDRWKTNLLKALRGLEPGAFERLCQRLLREEGLEDVEVIGGTGDGGLDGTGILRIGLISFPIFFQCKRYSPKRAVGPDQVRDFRGAMAGRGEKGLLITTSTFTNKEREEATRDGASTVDLIAGDDLAELLVRHELGVRRSANGEQQVDQTFLRSL